MPAAQTGFGLLLKGLILAAVMTVIFHLCILMMYRFMPWSIFLSVICTTLFFLIFWINMRYDRMLDFVNSISKTVEFGFKHSHPWIINFFKNYIRPINPFLGAMGTLAGILTIMCGLPALILHFTIDPSRAGIPVGLSAMTVAIIIGIIYIRTNQDEFTSWKTGVMFVAGYLAGSAGVGHVMSRL
ncbi:MAG: hypothetical protein ISR96_08295 [Nitrospira sp.]|nr:hypothetical protein [bacterium]MBL7049498.1 hypothetical protein [Nitrospira sp.]